MIRIADYIVKYLEEYGIKHIFMISGGGAMHLNDAIGKSKKIKYICNHHEQACAIAAEGYSRVTNKLSVVNVTSGPGGTNTLTGVIGQWLDSVPVLYISGQVKSETTIKSCPGVGLRQLGDQEINIIDIVKPVTKYSTMLINPEDVRIELEKAVHIATSGRPGPVWIDVPLNIQGAMIDETKLNSWLPDIPVKPILDERLIDEVIDMIEVSERPVIIAGHGIRISGAQNEFLKLIEKLNIPVVTSFNGFDLLATNHRLYIGRIGTQGTRAGNFAIQNSDLVISIGSRNNIRQVSYNWENFCKKAKKVIVDIDEAELKKKTVIPDIPINADAKDVIVALYNKISCENIKNREDWISWCILRKEKYPTVLKEYADVKDKVHPYYFVERLTSILGEGATLFTGNGTASVAFFHAAIIKKDQRFIMNSGCASMGYDLPAAIGGSIALERDVICLAGEGSLMMNLQEMQTLIHYKIPVKLFILNNQGYHSIRQTQHNFFDGRLTACTKDSGVTFPDFIKLGEDFGISTYVIDSHTDLDNKIEVVLSRLGPVICNVILDQNYLFQPKLSSEKLPDGRMISKPLEDMFPFLEREEFNSNILI